jgi:hypothetical protein
LDLASFRGIFYLDKEDFREEKAKLNDRKYKKLLQIIGVVSC